MKIKATEIFTPGSFPTQTYVARAGEGLENRLRDALSTPGQVISLIGPSKSGKTVLVEKVVGRDELITVTGAGLDSVDTLWGRVLDWMGAASVTTKETSTTVTLAGEGGLGGTASAFGLAKAEVDTRASIAGSHAGGQTQTHTRGGINQVVKEIGKSDYVVLIDDFHYMPRGVQSEVAKSIKEAVRLGVTVCTAAVRHRGDDLIRANPELRGRVCTLDLEYWSADDLGKIASLGFTALNMQVDADLVQRLVAESAGSPQLMQLLCLHVCFVFDCRQRRDSLVRIKATEKQTDAVFEQASANIDFRSLVDVLDAGPKTRGTERKMYEFKDGSGGDVYRCVLKAVASDPPTLSCSYDDLIKRTIKVCKGDAPVGSSVATTCVHMARLALDKFPDERAIDWDEQKQVLDIPDPYLLSYLRWSGRLTEPE